MVFSKTALLIMEATWDLGQTYIDHRISKAETFRDIVDLYLTIGPFRTEDKFLNYQLKLLEAKNWFKLARAEILFFGVSDCDLDPTEDWITEGLYLYDKGVIDWDTFAEHLPEVATIRTPEDYIAHYRLTHHYGLTIIDSPLIKLMKKLFTLETLGPDEDAYDVVRICEPCTGWLLEEIQREFSLDELPPRGQVAFRGACGLS